MSGKTVPRPAWPGRKAPPSTVQRAGAEAVFAAHTRVLRPPPRAIAEELVARPGGAFHVHSADRHTMSPPTGTFNFVRVQGDTPRSRPLLVSAKLAHAQIASGRPVVYAGTARFESGEMAWWSNYSGTYQPIAAFRAQAGLPENKFVPWQKLQMGGTAMQRGTFSERRGAGPPARPGAAEGAAADTGGAARPGVAAMEPKAQTGGGRGSGAAGGAGQTAKSESAGGWIMTGKVIQGFFLGGQPKLTAVQPRIAAPPPIQGKTAAVAPATGFAGRPPGPPIPAFAAQPPGPPAPAFAARSGAVQRQGAGGTFAAQSPGPPAPAFGSRAGAVQRHGAGNAFGIDSGALGLASDCGKPLPDAVRGQMEAALGADFSNVRVHVGPQAERIGAIAFTVGSDIYFAPGRYQPDTIQGQQLLGHELTHVVQQRAGRVRNPLGAGVAVVHDAALEAEADRWGARAAQHQAAAPVQRQGTGQAPAKANTDALLAVQRRAVHSAGTHVVQRLAIKGDSIISSFGERFVINDQHAVLTTACTQNSFTGGHAECYLEYIGEDGLALLEKVDLRTPPDGSIIILRKRLQQEYRPGWWASWIYSRSIQGTVTAPARFQPYLISTQRLQKVFRCDRRVAEAPARRHVHLRLDDELACLIGDVDSESQLRRFRERNMRCSRFEPRDGG